jgi:hypothetical protein
MLFDAFGGLPPVFFWLCPLRLALRWAWSLELMGLMLLAGAAAAGPTAFLGWTSGALLHWQRRV